MNRLFAVFRSELHRIFALRPVFAVIILAAAVYAVFYPQPYLNEALRNVPIAVVDQDGTQSSRELARLVDATPDVAVASVLPDVATAEREVYLRNIFGILLIPQHFERDLLHGRQSPVALYADASYFLMYQRMSGAVAGVARALGVGIETRRLIGLGVDPAIAAAATDPMPLTAVQLFNPQGGYATYILPGALILLLQQTLLIGVGLLGTMPGSHGASPRGAEDPLYEAAMTVLGKLMAYLAVEAVIVPFYLIGLPYLYGIPRLGSVVSILAVALPFSLAVGALGMVVALIFRRPLIVQLVLAAAGLPRGLRVAGRGHSAGHPHRGHAAPEHARDRRPGERGPARSFTVRCARRAVGSLAAGLGLRRHRGGRRIPQIAAGCGGDCRTRVPLALRWVRPDSLFPRLGIFSRRPRPASSQRAAKRRSFLMFLGRYPGRNDAAGVD